MSEEAGPPERGFTTPCSLPVCCLKTILGPQELVGVAKEEGPAALAKFKSCVRTTLSVINGYECQVGRAR